MEIDLLSDNPNKYAKRLAGYISDASTVYARTMTEFGRSPAMMCIKRWQDEARRPAHDYGEAIGEPLFKAKALQPPVIRPQFTSPVSPKEVIAQVAYVFDFTHSDIVGQRKPRKLAAVRSMIVALLYARRHALRAASGRMEALSLCQIGRDINRDHSTVVHSLKRMNDMRKRAPVDMDAKEIVDTYHEFLEDWGINDPGPYCPKA